MLQFRHGKEWRSCSPSFRSKGFCAFGIGGDHLKHSTLKTATPQPELLALTRERARADPEFREAFEIFLVSACDGVFLSTVDSETVFSRRKRSDFFYKRGVYEHRSVDSDESMGFELFCHIRDRLT
jgi:hypothetical protein